MSGAEELRKQNAELVAALIKARPFIYLALDENDPDAQWSVKALDEIDAEIAAALAAAGRVPDAVGD